MFDQNPIQHTFEHNGTIVSVAEYFARVYGKKITQPKQPLFLVKVAGNDTMLPTEFCLLDNVPDYVRKSPAMRDALALTRIDPQEKIHRIQEMVRTLQSQKAVKDWNIVIEQEPVTMKTNVLGAPTMISDRQLIVCDEKTLRKAAISKAVDLRKDRWIMVYENTQRMFDIADGIFKSLQQASGQLKIVVEDPYWIELSKETNREELDFKIQEYMMGSKQFEHPIMCLMVVNRESTYPMFKEVMLQYRIPSQVITARNGSKFNLSKATNILRQVNSKSGGDLFYLKFPEKMNGRRTMLIGIDVCHAGPQSIVGFSASINRELSQYYSDYLIQRKGQEIVVDNMVEPILAAIKVFAQNHDNEYPEQIVIYRDGVGDAQRNQVLATEVTQFEEAIYRVYNKMTRPAIALIVVNKRISQRFFVKDSRGQLQNPPSGCIIDRELVEEHAPDSKQFDFFLTPSSANQGCVLPTHFYVSRNDTKLERTELQHLTYSLCHFYFNWAGPIKVPAPCQYAHKIAEFYMTIGVNRQRKNKGAQQRECGRQALELAQRIERDVVPINHKLHFL